jgi:hypothetical protein
MHMSERIHIVLDPVEKERFRRLAEREGKSLSEWLRDVARARADAESERERLDTSEQLHRFFAACDEREHGREPDWEEHLKVILGSIAKGASDT